MESPKFKLACTPKTAKLHFGVDDVKGERLKFPLISVQNVYIFPGNEGWVIFIIKYFIETFCLNFHRNTSFVKQTVRQPEALV